MASEGIDFPLLGAVVEGIVQPTAAGVPSDVLDASGGGDAVPASTASGGDVMVVPSLCMGCEEQGITRLLLTRIPFFRDVILMAFECDHCGLRNSEVQSAEVQERGVRYEVRVEAAVDLNRQLVKGDRASARIVELDFEIPAGTQAGVFTTVEGLLAGALERLESTQPARRALDPASADAVGAFCERLAAARAGTALPFTLLLDDPSGNSSVENPLAPRPDARMRVTRYVRSVEQDEALGLFADNDSGGAAAGGAAAVEEEVDSGTLLGSGSSAAAVHTHTAVDHAGLLRAARAKAEAFARARAARVGVADVSGNTPSGFKKGGAQITAPTERARATELAGGGGGDGARAGVTRDRFGGIAGFVFDSSSSDASKAAMRFAVDCHNCATPGECLMCVTDVPHFKEVILMGFACDACGWKNVEVKGGGALPALGTVTVLHYEPGRAWSAMDMGRDVIKGDTASVEVPELDLVVAQGSLGGVYTTVEGLLTLVRDKLLEVDPLGYAAGAGGGDSEDARRRAAMAAFTTQLDACIAGARAFTLRLTDPMANSWVFSPYEGEGGGGSGARGGARAVNPEDKPLLPGVDPRLTHASYVRSHEEDLELGILDMDAPRGEEDVPEEDEEGDE